MLEERVEVLSEFVSLSVDVLVPVEVPLLICEDGGLMPLGARVPEVLIAIEGL